MYALFCDKFTLFKKTKSVNVEASELKKLTRSGMKITNLLKCKENNARKISEVLKCKENYPFEAEVVNNSSTLK